MAKEQQKAATSKELRKDIVQQLEKNLEPLKTMLGEKKFKSRVKKAARILSEGITVKEKKEKVAPKVPKVKPKAVKAAPVKNKPATVEVEKAVKKAKTPAPAKKEAVAKAEA